MRILIVSLSVIACGCGAANLSAPPTDTDADVTGDMTFLPPDGGEWMPEPEPDGAVADDLGAVDAGAADAGKPDLAQPRDLAKPVDIAPALDAGVSSSRLVEHQKGSDSSPNGYYSYVPPSYPGGAKWPLLIALHGVGENGNQTTELVKVLNPGIGNLVKHDKWPNNRPFIVLLPQHTGVNNCPNANEIKAFITWAMANYEVDQKRVYLTGLSCGAIGAWSYLGQELDSQIAALVPIAGNGKPAWGKQMCSLGKVPIWAFHGDADGTVNVSGTNVPMDGLAACPVPSRKDAIKTIYPGVGHNSWDQTYNLSSGHDIYSWMLMQVHN